MVLPEAQLHPDPGGSVLEGLLLKAPGEEVGALSR